jgi:8-oxo-dGTP pyrophosphatase MutT (NUDIX family)
MGEFRKLGEETIASGNVISFVVAEFETPDGAVVSRDIVHHPGAVAVVPFDGENVILVRQFRAPINGDLLEIPAGKRDVPDEDPALTASRELAEEVGLAAGSMQLLVRLAPTPGFCDEVIYVYLATDLTEVPMQRHGPEEEAMTMERMPLTDAVELVLSEERSDAKTLVGLLLAARALGA